MKFILGKKLDMTQVWQGDKVMAVTKVQAGPCTVVQIKIDDKDGYSAVQVGYGERKEKNIAKPQLGHLKKLKAKSEKLKVNLRYLREFRIKTSPQPSPSQGEGENKTDLKIGDVIDVGSFEVGDEIQATGISKGKGFQGVVKRHGFHGQDKTHGTKDQLRMPGSIGATGPAHVFKGQKMPGRMGGDRVTVKGLEVVEVDKENNMLLIKGAVPGARNGLVLISGEGELKLKVESNNKESGIMNKELGNEVESKVKKDDKKVESESKKNIEIRKYENKEVEKDEDIEKVVVEADKKRKGEDKK